MDTSEYLTLTEFAVFIKNNCGIEINPSSIRRYIMQGKIIGLKKIGYMWVIDKEKALDSSN